MSTDAVMKVAQVTSKYIAYARKLFLHCNRKPAGSSHLGLEESKKDGLSLEK